MIEEVGHQSKPKNYSRKGNICSCLTKSYYYGEGKSNFLDFFMVKYEIEFNKDLDSKLIKLKKYQWTSYHPHFGTFKKIIELPKIFSMLDEDEYEVNTGTFTRDGIEVPFIYQILIKNKKKYIKLKTQLERKNKLNNLKKNML